jgi:hypothetical protein
MFRPALALPLALLVPLAAAAAPRSFGSVGEFARAIGMKPGGWRTSFKVTAIEVVTPPGMDPAAVEAFKAEMPFGVGTVEERDECAATTPEGPSLPGILLDKGCVFTRMEAGKGRWAVASNCRHRGHGGLGIVTGEGTYSRKTVTGRQEVDHEVGGVIVRVKGETLARFIGKCRPSPATVPPSIEN